MEPDDLRPVDLGDHPTIAVVKIGDLGDVLLVTPLLDALRARYSDARIVAVVRPIGREVLSGHPAVDRIVDVPAGRSACSVVSVLRSAVAMRRERVDALVIAHHLTLPSGGRNHRWLASAVRAPVIAGLDNGRGSFLTHRALDHGFGTFPEWRYWLKVGQLLGAPASGQPYIAVPASARAAALEMLAPMAGRSIVAIHPVVGAYGPGRAWPVDRFAALAALLEQEGHGIVLVGGNDARQAVRLIADSRTNPLDLTGKTTVAQLAAVLALAALTIGADSGVVHLAATLERPTIALFGPSNHRAWAPFGAADGTFSPSNPSGEPSASRVRVLRSGIPCSPCFYIGHTLGRPDGCSTRTCLAELTIDLVADVARRMLLGERDVE